MMRFDIRVAPAHPAFKVVCGLLGPMLFLALIAADVSFAAGTRLPVPDAAAQARAEKMIREVFPSRQIPASEKSALAEKMITQAVAASDDLAARYVLLRNAIEVASSSGDVKDVMRATAELAKSFEVDADDVRLDGLKKCLPSATRAEVVRALLVAGVASCDEAAKDERYDAAQRYISLAESVLRGTKDAALIQRIQARGNEVRWLKQELVRVKGAEVRLAKNPADPDASVTVGRWRCFIKEDWEAGLPLLSKGLPPAMKNAATADLAGPTTLEEELAVADAWWDVAERESAIAQASIRRRAATWYALVLKNNQFAGLNRARVEKRLATLAAAKPLDIAAGGPRNRAVVLIRGEGRLEKSIFEAISEGKMKAIPMNDPVTPLAEPDALAGVGIVVWGVNRVRMTPITELNEKLQAALHRFVEEGGDLVMFEQFDGTNTKMFEKMFGIKVQQAEGMGIDPATPDLAKRLADAGYTKDALKEVHHYNVYGGLPEDATVLIRTAGKGLPMAVISPFGNGRLILIGTNFGANEDKVHETVLDFVYGNKKKQGGGAAK